MRALVEDPCFTKERRGQRERERNPTIRTFEHKLTLENQIETNNKGLASFNKKWQRLSLILEFLGT